MLVPFAGSCICTLKYFKVPEGNIFLSFIVLVIYDKTVVNRVPVCVSVNALLRCLSCKRYRNKVYRKPGGTFSEHAAIFLSYFKSIILNFNYST